MFYPHLPLPMMLIQRQCVFVDFVSVNPDSGYSLQTLGLSGISGALTLKELELQLQSQLPAVYQEHQGKYDWFFFECDRIPAAQDEEVETEVEMSIGTNGGTC